MISGTLLNLVLPLLLRSAESMMKALLSWGRRFTRPTEQNSPLSSGTYNYSLNPSWICLIRDSKKAIPNICRGFFKDFRHLENHFKYLTSTNGLSAIVQDNFKQQMGKKLLVQAACVRHPWWQTEAKLAIVFTYCFFFSPLCLLLFTHFRDTPEGDIFWGPYILA